MVLTNTIETTFTAITFETSKAGSSLGALYALTFNNFFVFDNLYHNLAHVPGGPTGPNSPFKPFSPGNPGLEIYVQ